MALKDVTLSNIYLGVSGAWLSGVPGTSDPVAADKGCSTYGVSARPIVRSGRGGRLPAPAQLQKNKKIVASRNVQTT